jgi:hypothetical protein
VGSVGHCADDAGPIKRICQVILGLYPDRNIL